MDNEYSQIVVLIAAVLLGLIMGKVLKTLLEE